MKLKISGGTLANPAGKYTGKVDIITEDGIITAVGKDLGDADKIINAEGLIVFPGFIDLHCHLREPGNEYKEDILSGTKAAVKGGYTAVCCMANSDPVNDNAAVCSFINERAKKAPAKVYPVGAATVGLAGAELTEMGEMSQLGCVAFSDDGHPIDSGSMMKKAMMYADTFGKLIMSHAEDKAISADGVMNEGYNSTILGLLGISRTAEETMTARDIIIAETYGLRVHIQHVSTRGSVELIRAAKKRGVRVSCESAPHYFSADDSMCLGFDARAKVNPPLREKDDVAAIKEGFMDGTIDAIATDHAPHHRDEKNIEFSLASFGISGFETAFSLAVTNLTNDTDMLAKLFSVNPARIIGKKSGIIEEGAAADITIADMNKTYVLTEQSIVSKGKNTPFTGQELRGMVTHTIVDGKLVYEG